MGMNIEFYSADPGDLVVLFAKHKQDSDFFKILKSYPMVDFSLHLLLPDDMDSLCRALNKQNKNIPPIFRTLLVKQQWFDNNSESLTLLNDKFAKGISSMSEKEIKEAAKEWATPFLYGEPLKESAAYNAVINLYSVAKDAFTQKRSLVLYLLG